MKSTFLWTLGLAAWAVSAQSGNIAWVSFHSAQDGSPSANAAAAGFTQAPDIGYTDLLTGAGHTVTRIQTADVADAGAAAARADELNGYDLVIVSRSANSAHYQQEPEYTLWNEMITAPVIYMSGYVLRANRLGHTTGNTIPDTTSTIKLTVNDPGHPIFEGIALDGSNTMVDDYAGINGSQRGISVNTDALSGSGTVLATVGAGGTPAGGAIISEWLSGAAMSSATPTFLGGRRLAFLSGSRETDGVTSETAGVMDLTAAGQALFLNAVDAVVVPIPVTDPPVIVVQPTDVLSVVGNTVNFSVVTDRDPLWTFEWFKNGVSQGANVGGKTLTIVTTAADKDAEVYCVVSNEIGTTTSATATLTLDDPEPETLVQGFFRGEHYNTGGGTILFPDWYGLPVVEARTPDYYFYSAGLDYASVGVNYGRIVTGWISVPVTGNYHIHMHSDDAGEIFLNPVGGTAEALPSIPDDFLSQFPDAAESASGAVFVEVGQPETSEAISLTAGEYYGFAAAHKQGGGADNLAIALRLATDTTPAASLSPINPGWCYTMASPAGHRATITQQPEDVLGRQSESATFTVGMETIPATDGFGVQWTKDGVDIPGATSTTLTLNSLQLSDDGAVIQARFNTLVGELVSDPATLTVSADNIPPTYTAGVYPGATTVGVAFSELINPASAGNVASYTVAGVTVSAVEVVEINGKSSAALLTVSASPAAGAAVTAGVTDLAGNPATGDASIYVSDLTPQTLVADATNPDPNRLGRSVCLGEGIYYSEAGGADIWGPRDAGYMAMKSWTGPFDIRVRVKELTGATAAVNGQVAINSWIKAGVMAREDLDGGARNVFMLTTPPDGADVNLQNGQWRDVADADSGSFPAAERDNAANNGVGSRIPNAWLRVVRADASSNQFDYYSGSENGNWEWIMTHTIPGAVLPETMYVGIASTSHNNGADIPYAKSIVTDFSVSVPVVGNPAVFDSVTVDGANLNVTWQNGGELQTAPAVDGTYTGTGNSSGAASVPIDVPVKIFRVEN